MMLRPYRVIDLTDHRGELASMVLGDLGAEVIKVEPPGGSASRRWGPFLENAPDPERSLRYFAYNRNKRGVVLDLEAEADRERFLRLVETADFLFESGSPGAMARLGLDFDSLRAASPKLVYVSITPFGQEGPHARFAATDLTVAAMGGPVSLQGTADRAPIRLSVPQVWQHASVEAAAAALVAHARMRRTREAQHVDVSAQASMVWTTLNAMVAAAIQGADFERRGSVAPIAHLRFETVLECADGHVVLVPAGGAAVVVTRWLVEEGVVPPEWLENEDWSTYDRRLLAREPLQYGFEEVLAAQAKFLRGHTKADLLERGMQAGVTVAPVHTVDELLRFRHLEERGYWLVAPLPNGREARVPGPFVRSTCTPPSVRRWAPRLGEHTDEVLSELENRAAPHRSSPAPSAPEAPGKTLPFAGLKVADFSWVGVGPITARYFADHGATVVRVESAQRLDVLRLNLPFKDGEFGINRSQFFGDFNTSKLGLALDLKNAAAVEVARRLLAWADVCLDSFTPGTMDKLGLGYKVARALNPSIVMASTCLMGQSGPAASFAGYGFHAGALAGFYAVTGWPDLKPDAPWVAYTDTMSPRYLAAALMAALDHRARTGEGQFIDAAQLEMSLHFLAPELIDCGVSGRIPSRKGNRSEEMAPHGVFPCAGDDQWCAIAVECDAQWAALGSALGNPAWAGDARFKTLAGRLEHQYEIEASLSAWTRERSAPEIMQRLQSEGIPAGVVQRSSDLLRDPQLEARGFHRYLEHPEMGRIPYSGHQFRIRGYDGGPRWAAPLLGQHGDEVMRDILGMSAEEIREVHDAGGIG
jgi:crotonobetainyl-CoA:carnitine CoA-transferase CaiB-like acyl-CoA transferase